MNTVRQILFSCYGYVHCVKYLFVVFMKSYIFPIYLKSINS